MKLTKKTLFFFSAFLLLILGIGLAKSAKAEDCASKTGEDKVNCYQAEVDRLSNQSKTLSNQIAQFNAQIKLTTLKISQTEDQITLLGGRIDQLEASLEALTKAFSSRAVETYKMSRLGDPVFLLVSAPDLSEAVQRFHYLQKIQEGDMDLLQKLQVAQTTYQDQKAEQEALQKQLESQKADLNNQKVAKAALLAVTQNDERKYQQLLAEARAELAVVQGLGKETYLRDVSEGDKIGTIISGRSGCSTGTHLHFEVDQGNSYVDPNNYLKPISFPPNSYGYNPDQYGFYGTISPHGSWNWPLNEPIQINQGFGAHGYATIAYPYTGGQHTGIDMVSSDNTVKAVQPGKLYGGSYQCGGSLAGTLLYAKVDQGNGMTTWYLHMIPQ